MGNVDPEGTRESTDKGDKVTKRQILGTWCWGQGRGGVGRGDMNTAGTWGRGHRDKDLVGTWGEDKRGDMGTRGDRHEGDT